MVAYSYDSTSVRLPYDRSMTYIYDLDLRPTCMRAAAVRPK